MAMIMKGPRPGRAHVRRSREAGGDEGASSTVTGFSSPRPIQRPIAMRWSMWVATTPPPGARALAVHDQVVALDLDRDAVDAQHRGGGARRSDSLTRSSFRPRIRVVPSANAAATASTGYSSIIDGARSAGTSTPLQRATPARADRRPPRRPRCARRAPRSTAPISVKRREQAGAQRIESSRLRGSMSEPGTISAATSGNAAEDGSAGTTTGAASSSGWPSSVMRRPCSPSAARRRFRAEMLAASSRCGRASPPSRSRWCRPARRGRRAAPPT